MSARRLERVLAISLLFIGCTRDRTEIVIGFATDLTATSGIDHVQFKVESSGKTLLDPTKLSWPLSGTSGQPYELPGSYGIASTQGEEPTVTLTLTGTTPQGPLNRTATLSLVRAQTLFYRMALVGGCEALGCPAGQSCVEGSCRQATINPLALPVYRSGMEKAIECVSGVPPTQFRNTSKPWNPMPVTGSSCGACQECIEGTCYKVVGCVDHGGAIDGGTRDGSACGAEGASCGINTPCCPGFDCYMSGGFCILAIGPAPDLASSRDGGSPPGCTRGGTLTASYGDGTFNPADWMDSRDPISDPSSSYTVEQRLTGGNPGTYRSETLRDTKNSIFVQNLYKAGVYDPQQQGAIAHFDVSMDTATPDNAQPNYQTAFSATLLQNGKLYWAGNDRTFVSSGQGWVRAQWTELSFVEFPLTAGAHPDLSATGKPLQFGYVVATSATLREGGIDNWRVAICH